MRHGARRRLGVEARGVRDQRPRDVPQALHLLPEKFHLAIFGGTHPNSLVEQASCDRYVKQLLKLTGADELGNVVVGVETLARSHDLAQYCWQWNEISHRQRDTLPC